MPWRLLFEGAQGGTFNKTENLPETHPSPRVAGLRPPMDPQWSAWAQVLRAGPQHQRTLSPQLAGVHEQQCVRCPRHSHPTPESVWDSSRKFLLGAHTWCSSPRARPESVPLYLARAGARKHAARLEHHVRRLSRRRGDKATNHGGSLASPSRRDQGLDAAHRDPCAHAPSAERPVRKATPASHLRGLPGHAHSRRSDRPRSLGQEDVEGSGQFESRPTPTTTNRPPSGDLTFAHAPSLHREHAFA